MVGWTPERHCHAQSRSREFFMALRMHMQAVLYYVHIPALEKKKKGNIYKGGKGVISRWDLLVCHCVHEFTTRRKKKKERVIVSHRRSLADHFQAVLIVSIMAETSEKRIITDKKRKSEFFCNLFLLFIIAQFFTFTYTHTCVHI